MPGRKGAGARYEERKAEHLELPGEVFGGKDRHREEACISGKRKFEKEKIEGSDTMKLITLNTHSLAEPDYQRKLHLFAQVVQKEQPDIIALQEVNQTISSPEVRTLEGVGHIPWGNHKFPVREDNHALALAGLLKKANCPYYWSWAPAKIGYEIYEEGLAVFSRMPIENTDQFFISKSHDFSNWKTRKMVGVKSGGMWFYSVHMGWWEDSEEPFSRHWDTAVKRLKSHTDPENPVWVMGDFNSPAGIKGEGWEYVKASGWKDTYELAVKKDEGITVGKVIDGWKERVTETAGMRIDYIFCNQKVSVDKSEVICNDRNYEIVSDHYGVMITVNGR